MNPSLEQSSIDTTSMMTSSEPLVEVPKILAEERMQNERMHDVLLLLEHLVEREEATVKLI
ncbi:MAG: hypothetical protein F6K10_36240, partial [Moorea sp. SIO2B7]|nr:hypothetical protein [Moorena sp. SIO2B7]